MKILLLHQYFLEDEDSGGSRWNEMTKVWTDVGHSVTVIAGMIHANKSEKIKEYKGKLFKKNIQGSAEVWRCHVSESYNKSFAGRLWGYFSFMFSSTWAGLFKIKDSFDLVLVTSPPLFIGVSGLIISWKKNIPLIFEVRDLWPESAVDTGVLKNKTVISLAYKLEKLMYKKARLINVLTPAFRETLVIKKHVPAQKIIFIPNASDFALSENLLNTFDAQKFRRENGLDGKFVLTYVGAHGVANHLIQIIDAAERVQDKPVLFQLIGDGMEKKMLVKAADDRSLKNVRFIDSVPKKEVFKYILASDIGMSVLKKVDTFKTIYSNKTFDYMSCKKPILMAIDGVSKDLVEQAQAGIFVEPENIDAFVKAIDHYLENPALLNQQGQNGYEFAKNNFDRNVLAKKYIDQLEKSIRA